MWGYVEMSDPVVSSDLGEVMAQIMRIINAHGLAGQVTLVSKTHADMRLKLAPIWSNPKMRQEKGQFSMSIALDPDDLCVQDLSYAVHVLSNLRVMNRYTFRMLGNLIEEELKKDIPPPD